MNVLLVVESYLPIQCGMSAVTKYIAEGLVNKGHKVVVATQLYDHLNTVEIINGVEIHRFNIYRSLLKKPSGDVSSFVNFVLNENYDISVIECIGSLTSDILMPYIDKIKSPKILHSHGNTFATIKPFAIKRNIKFTLGHTYNYIKLGFQNLFTFPKFIKSFDEVLILSPIASDRKIVERNAKKWDILDNAAEDIFFDEFLNNHNDYVLPIKYNKYIVSIANYTKVKNQLLLVKSYFESDIDDASLVMIGSKKTDDYIATKKYVDSMLKKCPGKDVLMLTGVNRQFIPQIIRRAYCYATSSTYEEYSISIIEAMSSGIPFISTNVGNARILPGGITIYNFDSMASAINKIFKDKELHDELSKEAKNYADSHNKVSIAVESFEDKMKTLVDSNLD